jgi:hypothetical protein
MPWLRQEIPRRLRWLGMTELFGWSSACHPEAAKTLRDLSCAALITQVIGNMFLLGAWIFGQPGKANHAFFNACPSL